MDVKTTKRLVAVIHGLHSGGAQKMMVSILNYFSIRDVEVHLIVFKSEGILKKELANTIILHELGRPSIVKGMGKCLKLIHNLKPSFIFSGIGHLNLALAPFIPLMNLLLPKVKWIARETNIVSLQNQDSKYPQLFDWMYRIFYKNYDTIIAQSKDMKRDLEKNYALSSNVIVINNPVHIDDISALAEQKINERLKENKINLLSVAGLRKEKCHELMLGVLSLLDDKYHLTIVGSGELEVELKSLAKTLKIEHQVSFLGFQSNPYPYMKNADLFLLTSQREGFPNVLLEANALGLPIVAFASLGGISEIIDEGINGFTVPFGDLAMMARKIEEASLYKFNTQRIKDITKERYAYANILKNYEQVFNALKEKK